MEVYVVICQCTDGDEQTTFEVYEDVDKAKEDMANEYLETLKCIIQDNNYADFTSSYDGDDMTASIELSDKTFTWSVIKKEVI